MKQTIKGLAGLIALLALLASGSVHAQSNGLGITPRKNYTIKPGSTASDTLYLDNLSPKVPLQVTIRVIDFKAQNESGTPDLLLATDAVQTPWSLRPFIHVAASVTVAARTNVNIPFSISIPANQGAGSYYSAVEYTAKPAADKQSLTVAASSATLVFVTVPGKANELLTYQQFGAFIPNPITGLGTYQTLFMGNEPNELAYTLQNNGDVAEDPQGNIVVKNMFGHIIKSISSANPKASLALIGQTRLFQACISPGEQTSNVDGLTATELVCEGSDLLPGHYTAQLTVHYGFSDNDSQKLTAVTSFWYIPRWFVIAVLIIIFSLVGAAWFGYYRYKRQVAKEIRED
jgi:hypothetical protein